jgi:hypothetical protein
MEHRKLEQLDMYATEKGEVITVSYKLTFTEFYNVTYTNFKLVFYYNKELNRIEYRYSFYIPFNNSVDDTLIFYSMPDYIDINTVEDDKSNLVKMMYSSEEYLKHLLKNNINLAELETKAIDLISHIMDEKYKDSNFSINKYLNCNPLNLEFGVYNVKQENSEEVYSIPIHYRIHKLTIEMNLHIITPDYRKTHKGNVKYYYEMKAPFIMKEWEASDIKEIDIGYFEFITQPKDKICGKLVNMYHIVDKPFADAIDKLEKVCQSLSKQLGVELDN